MIKIDIQSNIDKTISRFERLARRVNDMRPIWKDFLKEYKQIIAQNFEARGAIMNGQRWPVYWQDSNAPDKEYRAAYYRRKKGSRPMLRLTDRLYNAATGGAGWYDKIKKKSVELGIKNVKYSKVHQYGYKKRNIAQRPYLFAKENTLPARAWVMLIEITSRYVKDTMK